VAIELEGLLAAHTRAAANLVCDRFEHHLIRGLNGAVNGGPKGPHYSNQV
jgi:hypothetical protein